MTDAMLPTKASNPKTQTTEAIRVLVIDDTAYMRRSINKVLKQAPGVEVVGQAVNGRDGVDKFRSLRPDVICLDIDMPEMNGITALKHMMCIRPTPVVIVSSLTDLDHVPFEALRLGSLQFFPKPSSLAGPLEEQTENLVELVRSAQQVQTENLRRVPVRRKANPASHEETCSHLIVVGGTLGSTTSLIELLSLLSHFRAKGVSVLCQVPLHPLIVASFLESVSEQTGWVSTSNNGSHTLRSGVLYFLPDRSAIRVDDERVVFESSELHGLDDIFTSTSQAFGKNSTHVLLSGRTDVGLAGLTRAFESGSKCFIQDRESALFESWNPDTSSPIAVGNVEFIVESVNASVRSSRIAPDAVHERSNA